MNRRITGSWISTFFANGLIIVCGIGTGVLSARLLHADGRGALAAILLYPQLLGEGGLFGIHEALTQRISARPDGMQTALSAGLVLAFLLSIAGALTGILFIPFLMGASRGNQYGLAALYISTAVPLNAITLALWGFEHGKLRFWRYNITRSTVPAVFLAGIVALGLFHKVELETVLCANVTAIVLGLFVALYSARKSLTWSFSWSEARALLAVAWPFNLAALLLLVSSQIDRVLVVKYWDNRAVGLYFVALTVSTTGAKALTHTFQTVIFPNMARQPDALAQRRYLGTGMRRVVFIASTSTLLLVLLSKWVVPFAFGSEFSSAVAVVNVLAVAQFPSILRLILIRALRGLGDGKPGVIAEIIAGASCIACAIPLARSFGLVGIAAALGVANTLSLVYVAIYVRRRLGLGLRDWFVLDFEVLSNLPWGGRLFGRA